MALSSKIKQRLQREGLWWQYRLRREQLQSTGWMSKPHANPYVYIDFLPRDGVPDNCWLTASRRHGPQHWADNELIQRLDPEMVERVLALPYRIIQPQGSCRARTLGPDGRQVSPEREAEIRNAYIQKQVELRRAAWSQRHGFKQFTDS